MKLVQIEQRVKALEQRVERLTRCIPGIDREWYRTHAWRFADDPIFDEIVRLGRAYRKSQKPMRQPRRS